MDEKSPTPTADEAAKQPAEAAKLVEVAPVITQHSITLGRKKLTYTTTTGMMPLKNNETGEIEANIFFMAYTLDTKDPAEKRPLTFVFNGGPGSASVWLHLGALGPKRVKMTDEGFMPPPPYQLVDNEHTWLDKTDLVFVDPVGTGYSRAAKKDLNKKFWKVKGDIESVGEFIRLYLTRHNRWTSPLFMAGESYGTTRAAGLSGYLVDKGIAFNGIMLISTVMNFQTLDFDRGNDLPYALFLPTYAATAWYHKKLDAKLQKRALKDVLAEVTQWAETDYTIALMKGDRLEGAERAAVVEKLAAYTGLSPRYIEDSHLRIHIMRFCKELLRDQKRTVGRLDSRFQGIDTLEVSEVPDFDPSLNAITPPYTALFNHYARTELGYETDIAYETLSFEVNGGWEWDGGKYPDTSEALRSAFAKNPYLKLFLAMGYYDLATTFFATEYTLNHMDIDPALRGNIHRADYEAGHMLYLDVKSLKKLKADVLKFIDAAL